MRSLCERVITSPKIRPRDMRVALELALASDVFSDVVCHYMDLESSNRATRCGSVRRFVRVVELVESAVREGACVEKLCVCRSIRSLFTGREKSFLHSRSACALLALCQPREGATTPSQ
jgi:hypothetical protein